MAQFSLHFNYLERMDYVPQFRTLWPVSYASIEPNSWALHQGRRIISNFNVTSLGVEWKEVTSESLLPSPSPANWRSPWQNLWVFVSVQKWRGRYRSDSLKESRPFASVTAKVHNSVITQYHLCVSITWLMLHCPVAPFPIPTSHGYTRWKLPALLVKRK